MCKIGDYWKAIKQQRCCEAAFNSLHSCQKLANKHGLNVTKHTDYHYSIEPKDKQWKVHFYPGNRRIYQDKNKPKLASHLKVFKNAPTLQNVLESLIDTL